MNDLDPRTQAAGVRRGVGLFRLADRGLAEVTGGDRVRWLDGMLSNDVAALGPGAERSGCYAALLTPQGRVVADLQVLWREEALWLETAGEAVATTIERLERYVVADDVALSDRSRELARLGLEGPGARDVLEAAAGSVPDLAPDSCTELTLEGSAVLVAKFGWSGELAYQLILPLGDAERVEAALVAAGDSVGLIEAGAEALEILRVEAGVPRLGCELDESVLPAEARLERAVSTTKGCYTGQEVVARMASRGRVGHLLVGLGASGEPPRVGSDVCAEGSRIGEVTSACVSPVAGAIALGFVRTAYAEPGTELVVDGRAVTVTQLPFAGPGADAR